MPVALSWNPLDLRELPALQVPPEGMLIRSQYRYLKVLVLSCNLAKIKVDGPASGNEPRLLKPGQ